jgi:hypothetical protein
MRFVEFELNTNFYVENNQQNAMNSILLYVSFLTMAPTCFVKTIPSSGNKTTVDPRVATGLTYEQLGLRSKF